MIEPSAGRPWLYLITDFSVEEEHLALMRQISGDATIAGEVEYVTPETRKCCRWPLRVDDRGERVDTVGRHVQLGAAFVKEHAQRIRAIRALGCNMGLEFHVESFEPYLLILPSTMQALAGLSLPLDFVTPHSPHWRMPSSVPWAEGARMEMLGWRGQGKSEPSVARATLAYFCDFGIGDDHLPLIRRLLGEETTEAEIEYHPTGSRRMASWPLRVKTSFGDPVADLGEQIWRIQTFLARRKDAVRGLRELGGNLEVCLDVESIGTYLSLSLDGFARHQVALSFRSPEHPAWRPP